MIKVVNWYRTPVSLPRVTDMWHDDRPDWKLRRSWSVLCQNPDLIFVGFVVEDENAQNGARWYEGMDDTLKSPMYVTGWCPITPTGPHQLIHKWDCKELVSPTLSK